MTQYKRYAYLGVAVLLSFIGIILQTALGRSSGGSFHVFGSDDAFISYRYAENLFNGIGLVFNPGDNVEGYSNLLYTLLMVPGFIFGKDNIYIYSVAINCLLLAASMFIFWSFCQKHLSEKLANIGVILIALNPWIWINTTTGLETILILFATIGLWTSVESYKESKNLNPILFFCLVFITSRVDGFLLPLLAAVYIFITVRKSDGLKVFVLILVAMLIYTAFRYFYYDDVIANTFYNKVTGDIQYRLWRGFVFFKEYAISNFIIFSLIAITITCIKQKPINYLMKAPSFASTIILAWIFYLTYIGGDIYFERFIVQLIPLFIFTILLCIKEHKNRVIYAISLILLITPFYKGLEDERLNWSLPQYDSWETLGRKLNEMPKDSTLAVCAAGKIPYYSELYTIDMLGLSDRFIGKMKPKTSFIPGHEKFDPDYIMSRQPDFIASWAFSNLDMAWGITKDKFLDNYHWAYLVNTTMQSNEHNTIDVSSKTPEEIQELIKNGYNFGVIARNGNNKESQIITIDLNTTYNHKANENFFWQWSHAEDNHRWSEGSTSQIVFNKTDSINAIGNLILKFHTLDKQTIKISLNDHEIHISEYNGTTEIVIKFNPEKLNNGINKLKLEFPNARQPGNGDPRILAMALKSFELQ